MLGYTCAERLIRTPQQYTVDRFVILSCPYKSILYVDIAEVFDQYHRVAGDNTCFPTNWSPEQLVYLLCKKSLIIMSLIAQHALSRIADEMVAVTHQRLFVKRLNKMFDWF